MSRLSTNKVLNKPPCFFFAWQFCSFAIYGFYLQNKHKTPASFVDFSVPANNNEAVNKSALGFDENNSPLTINSSLKTF